MLTLPSLLPLLSPAIQLLDGGDPEHPATYKVLLLEFLSPLMPPQLQEVLKVRREEQQEQDGKVQLELAPTYC
jgi:hypothetical protein